MHHETVHLAPEELDLWLDGRLPNDRASHLETCPACQAAAEETRDIVLQLSTLPRIAPERSLVDQVMARVNLGRATAQHLTPDDLEQWVDGLLPTPREAHLRDCPECQALADAERVLVLRLQAVPLFNPAPGFSERVMNRVNIPVTSLAGAWRFWHTRVFANPISVGAAAAAAVLLGGSLAASAAWAAAHQDTIIGVGPWLLSQGQQTWQQGMSMASGALEQQSWYAPLRAALTPARIVLVGAAALALYGAGVVALRRLLALPAPQVSRALP
jgi:hypothetical protein